MGAVAEGGAAYRRTQAQLQLLASSPGFLERYWANKLLGSTPEDAAIGALTGGGLAVEHVLAARGDARDLGTQRARKTMTTIANALSKMVEGNLDRMLAGVHPSLQ